MHEKIFSVSSEAATLPELFDFASQLRFEKVFVFTGIQRFGFSRACYGWQLRRTSPDSSKSVQPFVSLVNLACTALKQAAVTEKAEKSVIENDFSINITDAIKTPWDTPAFFAALHEKIRQSIGDYAFTGALYDEKTDSIHIPYTFEEGNVQSIESFPLGEGLTSVLLRTKQPLLLNKNTEEEAKALGAKIVGKPAKSWMGTPLIIDGPGDWRINCSGP